MDTNDKNALGPGGDYERLAYLSLPFAYTQPAHLAALAALHGIDAPAAESANVLELGCASGGNLIPLAVRFPEARFLGLDLAERQIADGKRKIAALGLKNIELRQADIATAALPAGSFNYVICHGVYSWVPPAVQEAVLRLTNSCLVDNGVAAISYNVLPGWHLRSVLRDIFLHHAGKAGSPQERVARVRELLPQLAEAAQRSSPYGQVLGHEAKLLARMPSSYILGEFLAHNNVPCSFQDFTNRAAGHGLSYLCESDLGATARHLLKPEARKIVAGLGGGETLAAEVYLDMFTGRPFRRSILIKSGRTGMKPPALQSANLQTLHVSGNLKPVPAKNAGNLIAFVDDRGQSISTAEASIAAALTTLGAAFPGSCSLTDLAPEIRERSIVARAVLNLALEGRVTLSTLALHVGRATDAKPKVWSLARTEAAAGLPGVTSLRHVTAALPKPVLAIAAKLDGSRDRIELTQWMIRALDSGSFADVEPPNGQSRPARASNLIDDALRRLAECGLLSID